MEVIIQEHKSEIEVTTSDLEELKDNYYKQILAEQETLEEKDPDQKKEIQLELLE